MKSNKGLTLLSIVIIIVAMSFVIAVSIYTIMGPNSILNKEDAEPVTTNQVEV